LLLIAGAAAVFVLDRLTKLAVQRYVPLGQSRPLFGSVLQLTHTQNTGAAFSLGAGFGIVFLALELLAVVVILYFHRRVPKGELWSRVAMGMVLGGALGNAVDRLASRSVTDFIDLGWWPVFNIADMGIVVGAVILAWRLSRKDPEPG